MSLSQVGTDWKMNPPHNLTSDVNSKVTSKAWHTVLLCLFITVTHIHLKHILTFSLILECESSVLPPHVSFLCLVPNNATQHSRGVWPVPPTLDSPNPPWLHPPSIGLKWHQLLSPLSSREWCSVFSTSPHSCRDKGWTSTLFIFCFMELCLSFRNCFLYYFLLA